MVSRQTGYTGRILATLMVLFALWATVAIAGENETKATKIKHDTKQYKLKKGMTIDEVKSVINKKWDDGKHGIAESTAMQNVNVVNGKILSSSDVKMSVKITNGPPANLILYSYDLKFIDNKLMEWSESE